jgi:hypothetical protein
MRTPSKALVRPLQSALALDDAVATRSQTHTRAKRAAFTSGGQTYKEVP